MTKVKLPVTIRENSVTIGNVTHLADFSIRASGAEGETMNGVASVRIGERYCDGILVRVVCDGAHPFCAGLVIDRATDRVVFAAPILRHYMGQPADKVRQSFKRLGWCATIVRRATQ